MRLTKNDSDDIGFAVTCLFSGVLTWAEFQNWIHHVIETVDDPPHYVFDLLDIGEKHDFKPLQLMGWWPSWGASDQEHNALSGVGYPRFSEYSSDSIGRAGAERALDKHPEVLEQFRAAFPFIEM